MLLLSGIGSFNNVCFLVFQLARLLVSVFDTEGKGKPAGQVGLLSVFKVTIRPDVLNFVHTNMAKNRRQPYAVSWKAGYQMSAESLGTGRAVARIPCVRVGRTV